MQQFKTDREYWVIDRFEGSTAVLVSDDACERKLELKAMAEGSALYIQNGEYILDREETQRRWEAANALMTKIFG